MRGRGRLGVGPEGSRQVRVSWSERSPRLATGRSPTCEGRAASRFAERAQHLRRDATTSMAKASRKSEECETDCTSALFETSAQAEVTYTFTSAHGDFSYVAPSFSTTGASLDKFYPLSPAC